MPVSGAAACPRVAVIVLNYNGLKWLDPCFESLGGLDYPAGSWTPVLVDNASKDGSVAHMRAHHPQVQLLPRDTNDGFTGGNNAGMAWAIEQGYDYVVLVNNDTKVEPDWLSRLVEVAESAPDIAACGSKILTYDGKLIEFSGTVFSKETTHGGYTNEPNDGRYNEVRPAGYACGASCLLRVATLKQIGLLDNDYFIYHEDVDWGVRAWIAGWRVMYVPGSIMYHYQGGAGLGNPFRDYTGPRNALTTWLKCYELGTMRRFGGTMWRVYNSAPHMRRALRYNLRVLPHTLAKRRAAQRARRVSDEEFFRRLQGG